MRPNEGWSLEANGLTLVLGNIRWGWFEARDYLADALAAGVDAVLCFDGVPWTDGAHAGEIRSRCAS